MTLVDYRDLVEVNTEWLYHIPRHWAVRKLKHLCNVSPSNVDKKSYEGETTVLLCNYTDVYYNDVITPELEFMAATATIDQIEKFSLLAGDVIITKDSETADDIAISAYVPENLAGVICGYHLSMLRPRPGTSGAFVKWLFDSRFVKSSVAVRANGLTRVGLGQYALDNLELPFPPLSEQTAIAAFLDRETAKIDALIEEQKRLIDLLREKRQAVVSHAVTKGLNPDVKMKDSGIEWLGEVPQHWEVRPLRKLGGLTTGITPPTNEPGNYSEEGGYPWVRPEDLNETGAATIASKWLSEAGTRYVRPVEPRSTLVCCIGTIGKAGYVEDEVATNQQITAIQFQYANRYFYFAVQAARTALEVASTGNVLRILNAERLGAIFLPAPSEKEAVAISDYLDQQTHRIDRLIEKVERAAVLLSERRAALISAAVTGKIDVRDLVETQEAAE